MLQRSMIKTTVICWRIVRLLRAPMTRFCFMVQMLVLNGDSEVGGGGPGAPPYAFACCFETQRHRGTEKRVWVLGWRLCELCDSVFPKSAQGRLLDLWGFLKHRDTKAQRRGFGFWDGDSVNSATLCFQKSAQWLARGLILFFETQRMKKGRGKIPRPFVVYRLFGEPCAKLALQLCC